MNEFKIYSESTGDSDPKKIRLNWFVYEEVFDPSKYPTKDPVAFQTDMADAYISSKSTPVEKCKKWCYAVMPVLEFLNGLPWNNLVLNYVLALCPTYIRVSDNGAITADACPGRITVFLNDDKRTIKKIEKEVNVPLIGCDSGFDLGLKLKQLKGELPMDYNYANDLPKIEVDTCILNDHPFGV